MQITIDTHSDDITAAIATLELAQFLRDQPYAAEILAYFTRHADDPPATVQAMSLHIPGAKHAEIRAAWSELLTRGLISPGQPTRRPHDAGDEFTGPAAE